jgi:hypothetical protein
MGFGFCKEGRDMNIDIEKEREWWDDASEATEKALEYLDELEATRGESLVWQQECERLRADIADQRARDIRMMAHALWITCHDSPVTALAQAIEDCDRLSAITVPTPSEVKREGQL